MQYKIKPKGYPARVFEVNYMGYPALSKRKIMAEADLGEMDLFRISYTQGKPPQTTFSYDPYMMHNYLPYLSPLYEQIKKHCETWLANPAEPFPWETQEEFEESMKRKSPKK